MTPFRIVFLVVAALASAATTPPRPDGAAYHHWLGVEHHLLRSLDAASREYARTLQIDPARDLTPEQQRLVRRFAPRLYTNPREFFRLEDVAAIVHPDRRLIAYHLFWDDDIDFPEDNDPCDHEVLWVQYAADGARLEQVWTYFHGQMLAGGEPALREAEQHGMRPRINVQWGKHGSLPVGWERFPAAVQEHDGHYASLVKGRRLAAHGLGRRGGWPERFTGTAQDWNDFSKLLDPIALLDKSGMTKMSRWNSATISQHFLAYNFRPKTEWPSESATATKTAMGPTPALDVFQLPAKTTFDASMPRYPNLWVYLDTSLAESYESAVALMTGALRFSMRMQESFGPFSNPEGCDFEAGLEHLQPWQTAEQRALQHAHAFHIRYYHSALTRHDLQRVTLATPSGPRTFYRLATSAHYEVEHHNPHHADVETCPICGRTGDYAAEKGNLVERVHDPLGVELALTGTIRGERVRVGGEDDVEARELRGVNALTNQFSVESFTFPAARPDQNTLRIGVIVITPPTGR